MKFGHKTYDVGYTTGVYDMFHIGHLNLLRAARGRCRHLVVGVASDEFTEQLKGRAPIVPFDERMDIISALGIVDEVVVDRSPDKSESWARRPFDALFKGDDWQGTPEDYLLEKWMDELGIDVVYIPYTEHTSSSILRSFLTEPLEG